MQVLWTKDCLQRLKADLSLYHQRTSRAREKYYRTVPFLIPAHSLIDYLWNSLGFIHTDNSEKKREESCRHAEWVLQGEGGGITCYSESEVAQSCPTLCDPMDCSPPGSTVHGILQAKVLEWVASSFSRGSSWPRDRTQVSHISDRCFNLWATHVKGVPNAIGWKLPHMSKPCKLPQRY